jgi:hypothetical protein
VGRDGAVATDTAPRALTAVTAGLTSRCWAGNQGTGFRQGYVARQNAARRAPDRAAGATRQRVRMDEERSGKMPRFGGGAKLLLPRDYDSNERPRRVIGEDLREPSDRLARR